MNGDNDMLLDLFAAIAMHAELVTAGVPGEAADAFIEGKMREGHTVEQHLAWNAYNVAEAMLAERARRGALAGLESGVQFPTNKEK